MNLRQVVYKCPLCGGDMPFFKESLFFANYICVICRADFIIRKTKPENKIKIAGQEIIIDDKNLFNVLKRELNNETNEF